MTGPVVPTKKAVGLINDDQVKMVRKFFFDKNLRSFTSSPSQFYFAFPVGRGAATLAITTLGLMTLNILGLTVTVGTGFGERAPYKYVR